ncbi:hypothetical protein Tco_1014861, partial [Tanacetum coccineum]
KANVVPDALSRKEWMKLRRARAMSTKIHSSIKARILQSRTLETLRIALMARDIREEIGEDHYGLPNREDYKMEIFSRLYINEIVAGHGVLVSIISDHDIKLKVARDRQKSYDDNRRKPLEFNVCDKVLLKVSPRKGVVHFGKRSKLSPRYVGPFEIVERVGPVAYRLRLPQELVGVHDTFHVSNLKKYLADVNLHVPLEEVNINDKLHFVEEPMEIMDRKVKKLKKRRISIIKVNWNF